jgi:peptidyl-tRNA hydrolase, PTH1 family
MAPELRPELLVVGLGNPGEEYRLTPHNLGFLVIDVLAESHAIRVSRKENMSLVGLGSIKGKAVALAQPQTFMNVNGPAVKGLLERYELQPNQLIVVYDELALPWGHLRVRKNGSSAGHNGIKSLLSSLGTDEFVRLRIGINPGHAIDGVKFVLGQFRRAQMQEVEEVVNRSAEAVESIIAEGAEKAMATYNRRAQGLKEEEE